MVILDTNVISEVMRPNAAPLVSGWLASRGSDEIFTTTICQAEILAGIAVMPRGRRRLGLEERARAIFLDDFDGRVLAFDSVAALAYAEIVALRLRLGRPASRTDMMIAAIALSLDAAIVTRNVRDFTNCGLTVINPWES